MVRVFHRHDPEFPARADLHPDDEFFPVHLHELFQIPGVFALPHREECRGYLFPALFAADGDLFRLLPAGGALDRLCAGALL